MEPWWSDLLAAPVWYAGGASLCGQLLFTLLFSSLPEGPWRKMPGFLAHQVVAFALMLYMGWIGSMAHFFPDEATACAHARVEAVCPPV